LCWLSMKVEKTLNFARINNDLALRGVARRTLLCVSGSGLERMIDIDSPYPGISEIAALGTDPMKSNVIIMKNPSVDKLLDEEVRCKNAILKGTYSRILSTNARMLTRGVIPILTEEKFLMQVDKDRIDQRLIDLGSTNIVMDYAARVYFALNGLANLDEQGRGKLLLLAFQYLMMESARSGST
jgi:hypothetical protein